MSNDALQRAIEVLKIDDVFVNTSSCTLIEGFDPKFDARADNLAFQTKNLVHSSEVIEGEIDGEPFVIFRVRSDLGVRIACKGQFDEGIEDPEVLAILEAVMYADYKVSDIEILGDQDALNTFALNNAPYHVWPYWREYVTSQLIRMNMPKLVLPMFLRASNRDQ